MEEAELPENRTERRYIEALRDTELGSRTLKLFERSKKDLVICGFDSPVPHKYRKILMWGFFCICAGQRLNCFSRAEESKSFALFMRNVVPNKSQRYTEAVSLDSPCSLSDGEEIIRDRLFLLKSPMYSILYIWNATSPSLRYFL